MDGLRGWLVWAVVIYTCKVTCIHVSSVAIASGKQTGLACAHMQTGYTRACARVTDLFWLMHGTLCGPIHNGFPFVHTQTQLAVPLTH